MFKIFRRFKKLVLILIIFLFLIFILSRGHVYNRDQLTYGITFSKKQATNLGFDWQRMYLSILDDLTSQVYSI